MSNTLRAPEPRETNSCLAAFRIATLLLVILSSAGLPARAQAESPREQAIRSAGKIQVCIWPGYFAISYRDPRTGILEGIDIDLARNLARDLGVEASFVDSSHARFMNDLDAGRCDVAMFGIGVTPQRRERVDFTAPYLRSGLYGVTNLNNQRINGWDDLDQPGVTVAVLAGTYMEPLMRRLLKTATVSVVAAPATREAEVKAGRADALIADYPYTRLMVRTYEWARVIEPSRPVALTDYAYAVRKGDPQWLARVDAFVAAIKRNGRLAEAAATHGLYPIVVQ
ncbi:MAG: ABC transporter substrate-binding protein [Enhydrobacter sp.]